MSTSEPNPEVLRSTCHCGHISVDLPSRPTQLNECHCTICYKYGALWAYFNPDNVTVTMPDGATLEKYIRSDPEGDGDISFNRCSHCGCIMMWRGAGKRADINRMGVNCRMLDEWVIEGIPRVMGIGPRKKPSES